MAETIAMPKLGFDMAEGTLIRWVKAEDEAVTKGEVLAEIETDKATVEVESFFTGTVLRHLVEEGAVVPVGTPIAVIGEPGEKVDIAASTPAAETPAPSAVEPAAPSQISVPAIEEAPLAAAEGRLKASPLARRVAAEHGVDLKSLRGTGPGGRIVREDVEHAVSAPQPMAAVPSMPTPISTPAGAPEQAPADQKVPVDRLRAAIGRRMVESSQQVPHFYVTHEYDVEALLTMRKQVNETLPEEEKLSVNDFIVKGAALTLREFPNLNASLTGGEIVRHGAVNIGVAVSVPGGLLTVVSRNSDQKPMRQLSREIREMVARARAGKVRPEDIEGSTFSISNLGMYGVDEFTAIINPPEAAILAVGSARQVPVAVNGELKVGMRMKATLSADHRVTDGAEAAQFLQGLAKYLEHPLLLLI
ncbi:MAG: dihydrolipoamide acetyltransferase family protein [Anaerolineaceae bacterium]